MTLTLGKHEILLNPSFKLLWFLSFELLWGEMTVQIQIYLIFFFYHLENKLSCFLILFHYKLKMRKNPP